MEFDENGEYRDEEGILYTKTIITRPFGPTEICVENNAQVIRCGLCGEARIVAPQNALGGNWFEWHRGCGQKAKG